MMASMQRQGSMVLRTAGCLVQFIGGVAFVVGAACVGWATWRGIGTRSTVGRVIDEIAVRDAGHQTHYRPVIHYRVGDKAYRVEGATAWSPPMYRVGETVRVRYEVNRPENAVFDGFFDRWFLPSLFLGVGSVFLAVGRFFPRLFGRSGR